MYASTAVLVAVVWLLHSTITEEDDLMGWVAGASDLNVAVLLV